MEERIASEVAKDVRIFGVPVRDNLCLVDIEIIVRPGEVAEKLYHLFLSFQIAANELSGTQREGQCGNDQGQNGRIQQTTATQGMEDCMIGYYTTLHYTYFFCRNLFRALLERMRST